MTTAVTRNWTSMPVSVDFDALPDSELMAMVAAGCEARDCLRVLAKTGDNLVGEILRHCATFYEWDHYPPDDVIDSESHSQFYYHAHAADERGPYEHGHFHTFLRANGMPPGLAPIMESRLLPAPGESPGGVAATPRRARSADDRPCHLIAIAMDGDGQPIRLFTTNRWVTGDDWYRASDVKAMLDYFVVDVVHPSWAVNRWITAMLRLFRPQIMALLDARDRAICDWQLRHGADHEVFEDRVLDVTSSADIGIEDIDRQILAAELALTRRRGPRA